MERDPIASHKSYTNHLLYITLHVTRSIHTHSFTPPLKRPSPRGREGLLTHLGSLSRVASCNLEIESKRQGNQDQAGRQTNT
jgi:hypothetical protein